MNLTPEEAERAVLELGDDYTAAKEILFAMCAGVRSRGALMLASKLDPLNFERVIAKLRRLGLVKPPAT